MPLGSCAVYLSIFGILPARSRPHVNAWRHCNDRSAPKPRSHTILNSAAATTLFILFHLPNHWHEFSEFQSYSIFTRCVNVDSCQAATAMSSWVEIDFASYLPLSTPHMCTFIPTNKRGWLSLWMWNPSAVFCQTQFLLFVPSLCSLNTISLINAGRKMAFE